VQAEEDSVAPAGEDRGRGVLILAWVAIAFGAVSLPGLVGWLPGLDETIRVNLLGLTNLSPLTAVSSWAAALIATIISGIALLRKRSSRRSNLALKLAAPGAVLGTVAIVVAVHFVASLLGLTQGNAAREIGEPAVNTYIAEHSTLVCENGDGGYGPDNRSPWYTAYLDVPKEVATEQFARDVLRDAGFTSPVRGEAHTGYGEEGPADSFAVHDTSEDGGASIAVYPSGSVPRYCSDVGTYGDEMVIDDGRAIVVVSISLNDRE
jgi:hypothetical protein